MIELRNNPIEGSSVKLALNFKDPLGKYYIPISVNYTFLALNSNDEDWDVVDDLYEIPLDPASMISLVIPKIQTITGTTLRRKIIIKYQAFIDNEYVDFVDEVNFTIQPQPTIKYEPGPGPEPEIYIKVVFCDLVAGSLITAPLEPVFKMRLNMPVILDTAEFKVVNKDVIEDDIPCTTTIDMTNTLLNIAPNKSLDTHTNYMLKVTGLKSKVGDYELQEPFTCNFTTVGADPRIEESKDVEITNNGEYLIQPDDDYLAIGKVNVTVDVQPPLQEKTVSSNGEVIPDSEYYGLSKVTVNLPIEPLHSETISKPGNTIINPSTDYSSMASVEVNVIPNQDKEITITTNGEQTITADADKLLKSVKVITDVPLHNVQASKSVSVINNTSTPIIVNPDAGYDCMRKVEVSVNVPEANVSLYAYTGNNTGLTFWSTKEITVSDIYKMIPKSEGSTFVDFADYDVSVGDTFISFEYEGSAETLTRDSSQDITR